MKKADIEGVGNRAPETGDQALRGMGPCEADAVNGDWHRAAIVVELDGLGAPTENLHGFRKVSSRVIRDWAS